MCYKETIFMPDTMRYSFIKNMINIKIDTYISCLTLCSSFILRFGSSFSCSNDFMLSILMSCIKPTLIVTSAYERRRNKKLQINWVWRMAATISCEHGILFLITFIGSPMEAVSYVSVVLDACELSPPLLIFCSNLSLDSSFTIVSSVRESLRNVFDFLLSEQFNGDDSLALSSRIVEIDGTAATVTGSDMTPINGVGAIDFRPEIGSNLSSIESRGLFWPV